MEASESQPLLSINLQERLKSVRFLLFLVLVIAAVGGIIIGIWLLVEEGAFAGGGPQETFRLVNRTTWGALNPKEPYKPFPQAPPQVVVIIHTQTLACDNLDTCSAEVLTIQRSQMAQIWSDIAYNFLVGGDGRTYEGRGWDSQGAFAKIANNRSLGLAFIGDFQSTAPPSVQLGEAKAFLAEAVRRKKLSENFAVVGHNEVSSTSSPGAALYNIIKKWPHWKDCYMDSCFK